MNERVLEALLAYVDERAAYAAEVAAVDYDPAYTPPTHAVDEARKALRLACGLPAERKPAEVK